MIAIETADILFNYCKNIKTMFVNDTARLSYGMQMENSVSEYEKLLEKICQIADSLKILPDLPSSAYKEQDSEFAEKYLSVLNVILFETIKYRKKYCLIRRNDPVPGLASHIITNLGQIAVCLDEGYLPVVDTVNVKNCFTVNNFGKQTQQEAVNIWEAYFKQPFDVYLKDVPIDEDIAVKEGIPAFMPSYNMDCLDNPVLMDYWRRIQRRFMPLTAVVYEAKMPVEGRVLGVLCRGTDYVGLKPYNHPVQPEVSEVLEKAAEVMQRYRLEYCYLATEDQDILESFQKKFGDKLIFTQSLYYKDVSTTLTEENAVSRIDVHEKNMEYLKALYLLSKCNCFLGGRTSGTVAVELLTKGFEYSYIWNKGRYGIDDPLLLQTKLM